MQDTNRLQSIQAFRALAAFMVAFMHVAGAAAAASGGSAEWAWIRGLTRAFGNSGVDIFFVISGTIMYLVTAKPRHENPLAESADFLLRRAARLYPLFWVTLPLSVYALFELNTMGQPQDLSFGGFTGLVGAGLLTRYPKFHPVAWTLVYEVFFYASVALVLLMGKRWRDAGLLAYGTIQVVVCTLTLAGVIPEQSYALSPIAVEFVFGLAVGALVYRRIEIAPAAMTGIGAGLLIAAFVACYIDPKLTFTFARVWMYGIPAAVLIYGAVTLERRGAFTVPRPLVSAGNASYSFYLWHYPVHLALAAWWRCGADNFTCGAFYFASVFIDAALLSWLSYRFVEQPCIAWSHRISGTLRARRARAARPADLAVSAVSSQ